MGFSPRPPLDNVAAADHTGGSLFSSGGPALPRFFSDLRWDSDSGSSRATALPEITVGLLVLAAATWQPTFPAVTGMALVMLGAIRLAILRFRQSIGFVPLLCLITAVYGGLVVLCIGARLDLALRQQAPSLAPLLVDLTIGCWPVAAALGLVSRAVSQRPLID